MFTERKFARFSSVQNSICAEAIDRFVPNPKSSTGSFQTKVPLSSIARNYINGTTLDEILLGVSKFTTKDLLSKSEFPLHAIILSEFVIGKPIDNVVVTLQDVGVTPSQMDDVTSFVKISCPPLRKLAAAKLLGFDNPVLCFLQKPVDYTRHCDVLRPLGLHDPQETEEISTVQESGLVRACDLQPEEYLVQNLSFDDLHTYCSNEQLLQNLNPLLWPQVEHALENIQDTIDSNLDS